MPVPMVPDSRNTLERLELLPRDGESGRVAVHGRRIAVGLFVGVFALAAAAVGAVTHGVDLSTLGDTPEPHEALPAPRELPEPADHVGDADEYRADAAELGGSPQSTMALTVIPQNFIHESRAFVDQRELEALRKEALERGDADATSTLGLRKRAAPKRDLKASVITIALGGAKHLDDDDRDKTMDLIGRMARTYGEDAVRDNARLAPGVVAMDWPKSEENSEFHPRAQARRPRRDGDHPLAHPLHPPGRERPHDYRRTLASEIRTPRRVSLRAPLRVAVGEGHG